MARTRNATILYVPFSTFFSKIILSHYYFGKRCATMSYGLRNANADFSSLTKEWNRETKRIIFCCITMLSMLT